MQHKMLSANVVQIELAIDSKGYKTSSLESTRSDFPAGTLLAEFFNEEILEPYIVRRRGAWKTHDCALGGEESVLKDLLNMEETPDGAVAFANKWGLFGNNVGCCAAQVFYDAKSEFREAWAIGEGRNGRKALVQRWASYEEGKIGSASIRLRLKPQPEILWYVEDLRTFCWLELWRQFDGAAELVECSRCRRVFSRFAKGRAPQTCSEKCKKAKQRHLKLVSSVRKRA